MTKKWESDKNGNTLVSSYPGKKISQRHYLHTLFSLPGEDKK